MEKTLIDSVKDMDKIAGMQKMFLQLDIHQIIKLVKEEKR